MSQATSTFTTSISLLLSSATPMAGFHEPMSPWRVFLLLCSLLVSHFTTTTAQPATLQYSDCFTSENTTQKVDVSTVYAQFFPDSAKGPYINFTVIGTTPQTIVAASDGEHPVASECPCSDMQILAMTRDQTPTSDSFHDHRTTDLPTTQQQQQLFLLRDPPPSLPPRHS